MSRVLTWTFAIAASVVIAVALVRCGFNAAGLL